MKRSITWLVTFDGAQARAFEWGRAERRLTPVELGVEPASHHPMFSDRPTRTHARIGPRRGAGDPKSDGERRLEAQFVEQVIAVLNGHAARHAFDQLIIAAPPRALGDFRSQAPSQLKAIVRGEIGHDYVNAAPETLLEAIEGLVAP